MNNSIWTKETAQRVFCHEIGHEIGIPMMTNNHLIYQALQLWANYIETGNVVCSRADYERMGNKPKQLDTNQVQTVQRMRTLAKQYLNKPSKPLHPSPEKPCRVHQGPLANGGEVYYGINKDPKNAVYRLHYKNQCRMYCDDNLTQAIPSYIRFLKDHFNLEEIEQPISLKILSPQ